MKIAVCWKWVSIGDPGGPSSSDTRWAGVSPADEAALETALRLSEDGRRHGDRRLSSGRRRPMTCCGSDRHRSVAGRTDRRFARASTAATSRPNWPAWSAASDLVLCGDYSLDRGTGIGARVPRPRTRRGAGPRSASQVDTAPRRRTRPCACLRRLDGGRREVLDVVRRPSSPSRVRSPGCGGRRSAAVVGSKSAPVDVVKAVADEHADRRRRLRLPPAGPRAAAPARRRARPGARASSTSVASRHVPRRRGRPRTSGGRGAHRRSARRAGAICTSRRPRQARQADVRLGDAHVARGRRRRSGPNAPSTGC